MRGETSRIMNGDLEKRGRISRSRTADKIITYIITNVIVLKCKYHVK